MLRFSKKVEYALIALVHMSQKDKSKLTTARELSQNYHIPQELMGKVLQQLVKGNFVRSVQGVKGGYSLRKPIGAIKVNQVVDTIDSPIRLVHCLDHDDDCQQLQDCIIRNPMHIIQKKLELFFENISLKDIQQELQGINLPGQLKFTFYDDIGNQN